MFLSPNCSSKSLAASRILKRRISDALKWVKDSQKCILSIRRLRRSAFRKDLHICALLLKLENKTYNENFPFLPFFVVLFR